MSEECVYAYSRTSAFGTVIERILHGSFTGPTPHDVVLVKPNSLELLQLTPLHEEGDNVDDDQVLSPRFEQPTFGTITDARVLPCRFQIHDGVDDDEDEYMDKGSGSNRSEMDYEVEQGALDEVPYAFKLRQGHAPIQGEDVIVAVSDYGKLVFWGITSSTSDLTETGRFEPLIEVFMDEPGLEYQKVSKKLSVDP
ncbi:hypothetical protein BX666DRAFT_411681 [Dichotomocladium elegans]|nr:hypothetical protein BX666DRAFT_411681 [Dichotomocladium elegans]